MAETDRLLTGIWYGVLILCLATGGWLVYRQWHSDSSQRHGTDDGSGRSGFSGNYCG